MENDFCQNHLYYNYNMLITYFIKEVDYGSGMETGWQQHPERAAEPEALPFLAESVIPPIHVSAPHVLPLSPHPSSLPLTRPEFDVIPRHQIFPFFLLTSFRRLMATPLQKQLSWGVLVGTARPEELNHCQLEPAGRPSCVVSL